MPKALDSSGNGLVSLTGGAIVVDSNSSDAANITGNGDVVAPKINIYGNYVTSNTGTLAGSVKTGVAPTPDPLSRLPTPDPTTMTVQSGSTYKINGSGHYTLQPGVYNGGIAIGATSGLVTLNPGIYYMQGGGFADTGGISVSGNGVMIYNAPTKSSDVIKLTGSGNVTLSPPLSGTYKGITIYQDRSSTSILSISGGGALNLTGTVYAARAEVDLAGSGGTNIVGSQIIANNMNVTGKGSVTVDTSPAGPPIRDTRIVE
jgi:hypothetical protein